MLHKRRCLHLIQRFVSPSHYGSDAVHAQGQRVPKASERGEKRSQFRFNRALYVTSTAPCWVCCRGMKRARKADVLARCCCQAASDHTLLMLPNTHSTTCPPTVISNSKQPNHFAKTCSSCECGGGLQHEANLLQACTRLGRAVKEDHMGQSPQRRAEVSMQLFHGAVGQTCVRSSGPPEADAASMASQRTFRSPVPSLWAAHISSMRAASVVRCGRIACMESFSLNSPKQRSEVCNCKGSDYCNPGTASGYFTEMHVSQSSCETW